MVSTGTTTLNPRKAVPPAVASTSANAAWSRSRRVGSALRQAVQARAGHITNAGEIEKRKAFVQFADVSQLDYNGDPATFGIQETASDLTVFGHRPASQTTTGRQRTAIVATLTLGAHFFAVGDVAEAPLLAHKAFYEGRVAAEVIKGKPSGLIVPKVALE